MRKWTIMYLLQCDSEETRVAAAFSMFKQIVDCGGSKDVAVVFCIQMPASKIKAIEFNLGKSDHEIDDPLLSENQAADQEEPDTITTAFFKLVFDETNPGLPAHLVKISEEPAFSFYEPTHIAHYFKDIIRKDFEAEKYLLLTWGHGAAVGLFPSGKIAESNWKILLVDQLKDAITAAFDPSGPARVNLVIMMNCLMQYFDTGLALKLANVDYLVSSECGNSFSGYNYTQLFTSLYNNPNMSPLDIATLAVTSLDKTPFLLDQHLDSAFFVNELASFTKIAEVVNALGALINNTVNPVQVQKILKQDYYLYNPYGIVDILAFARDLQAQIGGGWGGQLINDLKVAIAGVSRVEFKGSELIKDNGQGVNGWSSCIPLSGDNYFYEKYVKNAANIPLSSVRFIPEWTRFVINYASFIGNAIP